MKLWNKCKKGVSLLLISAIFTGTIGMPETAFGKDASENTIEASAEADTEKNVL